MNNLRSALALLLPSLLGISAVCASPESQGEWRVIRVIPSPWVAGAAQLGPPGIRIGDTLTLSAEGVDGPEGRACTSRGTEQVGLDEAELFGGALPDPLRQARTLGLPAGSTATLRFDCEGVFWDFHQVDADILLTALDHRILALGRSPGTRGVADTAAGRVQRLLEAHYAGSMGFTKEHWTDLEDFLTTELRSEIAAWSAAPWPDDEPPPINGDPLTASQEYPTRFHVAAEWVQENRAAVEVDFADAYRRKRLVYTMWLEDKDGIWRLRDVHGESGESFVDLLMLRPD